MECLVKIIFKKCSPCAYLQEEGWKLNRTNYYQEGWLASGNTRGIVGVTFSTSHCKKNVEFPQRTNYNLRGHRSDVSRENLLIFGVRVIKIKFKN